MVKSPAQSESPLWVTAVFFGGALLLAGVLWFGFESSLLVLGVAFSIGLCLMPFLLYRREPSPIAPVYLTMVYLMIAYPVKLIAVRAQIPYVREDYPGLLWDNDLAAQVMGLLVLGLAGYFLGYYKPPRLFLRGLAKIRLPLWSRMDNTWPWRVLVISLIGWAAFGFQIMTGSWSSFAGTGQNWDPRLNQLLDYLWNYVWFSLIAALLWFVSKKYRQRTFTGNLLCLIVAGASFTAPLFLLGSKTWLIYPFIWILAAAYMSDRRPSPALIFGIFLVTSFFAFNFVPMFRSLYLDRFAMHSGSTRDYIETSKDALSSMQVTQYDLPSTVGTVISRFGGVDNAARVVSLIHDRVGFLYFREMALFPFSLIPRAIFPNKPTYDVKQMFTIEFAGMSLGGSAAPHPVGEGYLNLGWLGVFLLFWLWGLSQALFYRGFYLPRKDSPLVQMFYAFYMLHFIGFGGWILRSLLGLPGQMLTLMPLILIFRSPLLNETVREKVLKPIEFSGDETSTAS